MMSATYVPFSICWKTASGTPSGWSAVTPVRLAASSLRSRATSAASDSLSATKPAFCLVNSEPARS